MTTAEICPCGSKLDYSKCCERYISDTAKPPTAEACMRARYTSFVKSEIAFIKSTVAPESRKEFDEAAVTQWSKKSEWMGLEILRTEKGGEGDTTGGVEFNAKYRQKGKVVEHHEVSTFRKADGQWYFVDGESHEHHDGHGHGHHHHPTAPIIRAEPKIGRNDPCHCGSGQKYKKCHGANA